MPPLLSFGAGRGEGRRLARRVVQQGLPDGCGRPTAVVCITDTLGHSVLREAAERGLAVTGNLSVIVFGDLVAPYTSPPLCGYGFRQYEVGVEAASLLARLLRGERPAPSHVTLEATFTCRGSCGAPPQTDAGRA